MEEQIKTTKLIPAADFERSGRGGESEGQEAEEVRSLSKASNMCNL